MKQKRSLSEALQAFAGRQQDVTQAAPQRFRHVAEISKKTRTTTPARAGKRLVGGHFDRAVSQQLRELAAREDTTVQALLANAINMLFIARGLPAIAEP